MANVKISSLPRAISLGAANSDELFLVVQDNTTKKITLESLLSNLNRPVTINSIKSTANDFSVNGSTVDDLIHTSAVLNKISVGGSEKDQDSIMTVHGDLRVMGATKESADVILPVDNVTAVVSAPISISKTTTALVIVDASTYTLGPGKPGQWKIIHVAQVFNPTLGTSPRAEITVTNVSGTGSSIGPSKIRLLGAHASVTLLYDSYYTEFAPVTGLPIPESQKQGWIVLSQQSANIEY